MSDVYYNEYDKNLVKWLKELCKRNLISPGDIDDRPIQEVKSDEIKKYKQVHLFAGIGGWSYALKLAGWNEQQQVWTGSCPCQPFSKSGKLKATTDERHLWPEMLRLITEARPEIIFGEQVTNLWWADIVADDLERNNYSFWAEIRRASSIGANHERRRLFWASSDANRKRQSESWICGEKSNDTETILFRETDRFVDAIRRQTLPYLCKIHDGLPRGMGQIACIGYGNAIVPQLAREFIYNYIKL